MDLTNLGLSPEEYRTYTEILKSPPTEIADLAKRAHIKRSTLYTILESLSKKGLIKMPKTKDDEVRFYAVSPEKLVEYTENHLKNINGELQKLKDQVPLLNLFLENQNERPLSKEDTDYYAYYNDDNFAKMYEIVNQSKGQMYGLTDHHYFEDVFELDDSGEVKPSMYLDTIMRVGDKFVFTGTPETKREAENFLALNPQLVGHWEPRYIDRTKLDFKININVFDDKLLITQLYAPKMVTHYLRNQEIAESFIKLCQYLWESAEPIEYNTIIQK